MNIYKHELRQNLLFTIIWSLVITGMGSIVLLFYPVIQTDIDAYIKVLNNFPPAFKAAVGIFTDLFSTPLGFYSFGFTMSLLFAGIQSLILGVSIVSKEVRDQTADFLMTKPVKRVNILNSKILASLTLLLATWLFFSVCMFIILHLVTSKDIDIKVFLMLCAAMLYIQIVLFSIGLLVSVVAKRIRAVLPVALGIGLFLYAMSAFAVTSESDKLRYFTPYEYMKPEYIITNQ